MGELFEEAGLTDRGSLIVLLSSSKELKASDLAKKLGPIVLMPTIPFRLTQIGLVNVTADRPMNSPAHLSVLFKKLIKDQKYVLIEPQKHLKTLCQCLG